MPPIAPPPDLLPAPLSRDDARAAADDDGWITATVAVDVLELISRDPHRGHEILLDALLEDTYLWRAMKPIRLLGDVPGRDDDPRRQWMYVRATFQILLDDRR